MRALRKENNQNIYASSQYIHIKKFGICMVFLQNEISKAHRNKMIKKEMTEIGQKNPFPVVILSHS